MVVRRRAVEAVIEWAVAPAAPLPRVAETDAVAAFVAAMASGPRIERVGLCWLLAALDALGARPSAWVLGRLLTGRLAALGELLAALGQLAYYGDLGVLRALGYEPAR
jgi:hypothetical protein